MSCKRVDFPHPLGPTTTSDSPAADLEVDIVDGADQGLAATVVLGQVRDSDGGTHRPPPHTRSQRVEPGEVRLDAQDNPLQQQRCIRPVRLGHRRPLGVPQTPYQLETLRPDQSQRVRESPRRGDRELEVEVGEVGPRPASHR